ncbi:MAG: serine/threonine-protein kinase [Polyangiaceae bacterium]
MQEEGALAPGTRVDGYVVERMIGAGGMARVYAASHAFLGVRVALKVLHAQYRPQPDVVAKLRGEAQLLRTLDHPNLVRVSDAGVAPDGAVWMAMDLLAGETLRARLDRSGALPLEVALGYTLQAIAGLQAAHGQGVIHRDLKPENLFITERGELKLLDFGTAKFRDHAKTAGTGGFATLAYAAPEQIVRGGVVDARTDIYSLGIVLHEALTGWHFLRRPDRTFPSMGDMVMLQMSVEPPVDRLSAPVAAVVRRATAKRSADRYASMQEFGAALRGLLRPAEAPPAPDRPAEAGSKSSVRGARVPTTAALMVLAAALSSGATFLVESRARSSPATSTARPRSTATSAAEAAPSTPTSPSTAASVAVTSAPPTTPSAPATSPPAPSAAPSAPVSLPTRPIGPTPPPTWPGPSPQPSPSPRPPGGEFRF